MRRVVCIGSVSQDIFFPTREGVIFNTPKDLTSQVKVAFELGGKFRVDNRYESIGGVAANVSIGLARLGTEVACYSYIGRDDLGQGIHSTLEREGVNTRLLIMDPTVRSDLSAIVVVAQTGDRIIFHNRDANERLQVTPDGLTAADWLYVSALNGAWRENLSIIRTSVKQQDQRLALNPGQHNLKDDPQLMLDLLHDVHVLLLNKDEAIEILLSNKRETRPEYLQDEICLVRALHQEGPHIIALTDGKRGAWVSDGKSIWHAQSYEPHGLVDTTGGGDAFGSGFFAAYLKGYPLERCLQYGISNAGSVVGFYGATRGLLDEEALLEFTSLVTPLRLN